MKNLILIASVLSALTSQAIARPVSVNGTYTCHLGSYADGGKWQFKEGLLRVTKGDGELKLEIAEMSAEASSDSYHGTFSVELSYRGIRSSGNTGVGGRTVSTYLLNDQNILSIPTTEFWCDQFKEDKNL